MTPGALAHDHPFIKEAQHAGIALDSLALAREKAGISTFADGLFRAQWFSVVARVAEETLLVATFRALAQNHPLKVPFPGTGMVLDGHLKGHHAAGIADEGPEEMIVVRIAMGSNAFSGKCFQV
jgi:hypothetical protein